MAVGGADALVSLWDVQSLVTLIFISVLGDPLLVFFVATWLWLRPPNIFCTNYIT